jgi:serine/threonine-protein kinase ATR
VSLPSSSADGRTKASAQGIGNYLRKITSAVDKARQELPEYQWFTAFPQLVSRVGHSNPQVSEVLMSIIARVITRYPQQALWSVVGVLQSKKGDRHKRCTAILAKAANDGGNTKVLIESAQKVAGALLRMCLDNGTETDSKGGRKDISKDRLRLSMAQHFYYVSRCVPSRTILPLQDALTCTLPTSATTVKTHNPFPDAVVEIIGGSKAIKS